MHGLCIRHLRCKSRIGVMRNMLSRHILCGKLLRMHGLCCWKICAGDGSHELFELPIPHPTTTNLAVRKSSAERLRLNYISRYFNLIHREPSMLLWLKEREIHKKRQNRVTFVSSVAITKFWRCDKAKIDRHECSRRLNGVGKTLLCSTPRYRLMQ